jgi:hypothetical protein
MDGFGSGVIKSGVQSTALSLPKGLLTLEIPKSGDFGILDKQCESSIFPKITPSTTTVSYRQSPTAAMNPFSYNWNATTVNLKTGLYLHKLNKSFGQGVDASFDGVTCRVYPWT